MKPKQTLAFAVSLIVLFVGSVVRAETITYEYDVTGRLTAARHDSGLQIFYVYDAAGNLLAKRFQVFTDTDGDSMDDGWESTYFGDLTRTGLDDFDQDGAADRNEFLAGTDPVSSASVLRVTRLTGPAGDTVQIEWQSVAGKRYRVQFKNNLADPGWTDLAGDITASGPAATKTDSSGSGGRYYRVSLIP